MLFPESCTTHQALVIIHVSVYTIKCKVMPDAMKNTHWKLPEHNEANTITQKGEGDINNTLFEWTICLPGSFQS
jgi:hypothetical protein